MHFVYVVRCADSTLYVGRTTDLEVRLMEHNNGRGGTYTMHRRPVSLMHVEEFDALPAAIQREKQIKHWTSAKKEALIHRELKELHRLARRRKSRRRGSST